MLQEKNVYGDISYYEGCLPDPEGGAKNFSFLFPVKVKEDLLKIEPKMSKWMNKPESFFYLFTKDFPIKGFVVIEVRHENKIKKVIKKSWGIGIFIPFFISQFFKPEFQDIILEKIEKAATLSKEMNAHIIGLGATTSIITNNGKKLADKNILWVTSGSSTTAIGVEKAVIKACRIMRIKPAVSTVAIIGASGAVGRVASLLIASHFGKIITVARNAKRLERLKELISARTEGKIEIALSSDINDSIKKAQVVIMATNVADSNELLIDPRSFLPGSVVCDLSIPTNISKEIKTARSDVFFFDGAVFKFKGKLSSSNVLDMGADDEAYGCLKETMDLALEGVNDHYSIGPLIGFAQVQELKKLSKKYFSPLAGWKIHGERITKKDIKNILKCKNQILNANFKLLPQPI